MFYTFFTGINQYKYRRTTNCWSVGRARVFGLHCILGRQLECSGCCMTRGPSVRYSTSILRSTIHIKASRRWWIALVFHLLPAASSAKKRNYSFFVFIDFHPCRISVRTMRGYLLVLLISLVTLAVADEKYTRKYDDVNVDKILQNNRVLTNYIRCLMDEGPCTAEGRELRSKWERRNFNDENT